MTRLGMRLETVPAIYGWDGLLIFVRHLPNDSATISRISDKDDEWTSSWTNTFATNQLLAEIFDAIKDVDWVVRQAHSTSKVKRPEPLDKPWSPKKRKRHFGSEPIARDKFIEWYYGGDNGNDNC